MNKAIVTNPLLDYAQQRSVVKDFVVVRNFMTAEMYDDFLQEICLSANGTSVADKKDANMKSTLGHVFQNLFGMILTNDPEFTGKVLSDYRRNRIGGDVLESNIPGVQQLFDFQ